MSTPDEKRRALERTLVLLMEAQTMPLSKILSEATACLRHYPARYEIQHFVMVGEERK